MNTNFDFKHVTVSWTKYDVVHVLDVVENWESMQAYYAQDIPIDPSVLRAFIGIRDFSEPIPEFWSELFRYDLRIRNAFAFFLMLFSHHEIAMSFAKYYMNGPFKGVFQMGNELGSKVQTNIRSLLVESGLSLARYRRSNKIPFDGTILFNEKGTGPIFKKALENYFRKNSSNYDPDDFFPLCIENEFYRVLGLTLDLFTAWLEGKTIQPALVQSISFDRFLCFNQSCSIEFDNSKEVYLVGENGDGKTILLMSILAACRGYRLLRDADVGNIGEFVEFVRKIKDYNLQAVDDLRQTYKLDNAPQFDNVFAYGVHRGRFSAESDDKSFERYGFMTLFSLDKILRDPVDWLLKSVLENPYHEELSFERLQKVLGDLLEQKIQIVRDGSQIKFKEKGLELSLLELSEGYRSTLIFICDLLIRLSDRTPDGENVFEQSGVVLIDEICLHLHPRWQRTIVGKLRALFPNLQFIMTTHSPVILMGASEDAIFYRVIREDGNSYISDPYYAKDLKKMMLNTIITSSLFSLDSAAMSYSDSDVDTSDSYLHSRIGIKVEEKLNEERKKGKHYLSNEYIDGVIEEVLKELLG